MTTAIKEHEDESAARRPRGRPQARPDRETRHLIAEAAMREFVAQGYSGAGMDDVAKGAGVSKRTLYRLVPTKADLFKTVLADRVDRFLGATDLDSLGSSDPADALEHIMTEIGFLALSQETAAIHKLVIAENDRFPELAASFHTSAVARAHKVVADYLRMQRGLLDIANPDLAAGMLCGMMVEPQRAIMVGQAPFPSRAEIAERAHGCVTLFLNGCLRPSSS